MFINITNHPSSDWPIEQLTAAEVYGEVVDVPFPVIMADYSGERIDALVAEYHKKVMDLCGSRVSQCVVLLSGEYVFTFRLVTKLRDSDIRVVAAVTERVAREEVMEDGTVKKTSVFKFAGFRDY